MIRSLLSFALTVLFGSLSIAGEPNKVAPSKVDLKSKKPAANVSPSGYLPAAGLVPLPPAEPPAPPSADVLLPFGSAVPQAQPAGSPPRAELPKETPAVGQKKWEKLLNEPADLDFGDRKTVTVKELLDGLRERHKLSLRLDIPTLSALVGAENVIKEPKTSASTNVSRPDNHVVQGSVLNLPGSEGNNQFRYQLANQAPAAAGTAQVAVESESVNKPVPDPIIPDGESAQTSDDSKLPSPLPAASESKMVPAGECKEEGKSDEHSKSTLIERYLSFEVNTETMDLKNASVGTVLRQTLDAMPIVFGADFLEMPFPISLSNACLLDYLIEKDGLVITTRMQALSHKETRVYSIRHLRDLKAEELAKIIRQSVRPWSWRSQINDLGDQLRGSFQLPPEVIKSAVTTGVQLAAAQAGATVTISESEPPKLDEKSTTSDAEQLKAIGNATVNGLVTFAHATVLGLEMAHHADFPTGTIATLPGKLIVTQSQAAHREIAELLQQLADE
jgi:hypothetical protein